MLTAVTATKIRGDGVYISTRSAIKNDESSIRGSTDSPRDRLGHPLHGACYDVSRHRGRHRDSREYNESCQYSSDNGDYHDYDRANDHHDHGVEESDGDEKGNVDHHADLDNHHNNHHRAHVNDHHADNYIRGKLRC
jgi:hypothetical protein